MKVKFILFLLFSVILPGLGHLLSAAGAGTVSPVPLYEDFEHNLIPPNWTVYNFDSDADIWNTTDWGRIDFGSYAAHFEKDLPGGNDWLVTPPLLPQSGDSLTFWLFSNNSSVPLKLMFSVNGPDSAAFALLDTCHFEGWKKFGYDLSGFAGDTVYAAFVAHGGFNYYLLDEVRGPEFLLSDSPQLLQAETEVNLNDLHSLVPAGQPAAHWLKLANYGGTDLQISGFLASSSEIMVSPANLTLPPLAWDSLLVSWTPAVEKTDSGWVLLQHNSPVTADSVHYQIQSVPAESYVIGFEAPAEDWFKPQGYGLTKSGFWHSATATVHWGSHHLAVTSYSDTSYLYSPRLDLSRGTPQMSFFHRTDDSPEYADTMFIEVSPNGGYNWFELGRITENNTRYKYKVYSLLQYQGSDNVIIRWHFVPGQGDPRSDGFIMDDLALPPRYTGTQGVLYASISEMDFGTRLPGDSLSYEVELMNSGAALNISSILSTDPAFSVSGAPAQIGPFQRERFTIHYHPSSPGEKNGQIQIQHDGINGSREQFDIPVRGTCFQKHAPDYLDPFESSASLQNYLYGNFPENYCRLSDADQFEGNAFNGDSALAIWGKSQQENTVTLPIDLAGGTSARLSFAWGIDFSGSVAYFTYDIYDGQWHKGLDTLNLENTGPSIARSAKYDTNYVWYDKEVDLSPFNATADFKIRFRSKAESVDTAYVDDLRVVHLYGNDIKVSRVEFPAAAGQNVNYSYKVEVRNMGTAPQTAIPVKFLINGAEAETRFVPVLQPNERDTLEFLQPLPQTGNSTIKIQSFLSGDEYPLNDFAEAEIPVLPVFSLPYSDDFEDTLSLPNYHYTYEGHGSRLRITGGDSLMNPVSGAGMLTISSRNDHELSDCNLDLYLDLSGTLNPQISVALGSYSLAYPFDSLRVDVYDGVWHRGAAYVTETSPMTQFNLSVNENGWQKINGFIVRFFVRTNFAYPRQAAFIDNFLVYDKLEMGRKLLISEIVTRPLNAQFIEIFNPGDSPVLLGNYFLSDATDAAAQQYYYNIVTGSNMGGGQQGDFHAHFPQAAVILAGEYQTIALQGDSAFYAAYGIRPTYELYEDGSGGAHDAPDLREAAAGTINMQGMLPDSAGMLALYFWNDSSDLVQDADYLIYNTSPSAPARAVDKSGVSLDGPDPDTLATVYLNDTPLSAQQAAPFPQDGFSLHRVDFSEGQQLVNGGNGISGADETSEDLQNTFSIYSLPSPNGAYIWPKYNLEGTVMLADSAAALPGTCLRLEKTSRPALLDTTGAAGHFKFTHLDSGTYALRITRLGYLSLDTTLFISRDSVLNFTLQPQTAVAGFAEDFENGIPPAGWSGHFGPEPQWHLTQTAFSGSAALQAGYQACISDLYTPKLNLAQLAEKKISFHWSEHFNPNGNSDSTIVQISTDGENWQTLTVLHALNQQPAWHREELDISQWAGSSSGWIRWRYVSGGGLNAWPFSLDAVAAGQYVAIQQSQNGIPQIFDLAQNYPNPFNPQTTIKYQLPEKAQVTLEIFNSLGQKVRTLVSEPQNAGYYRVVWNGLNDAGVRSASGVYIYRLRAKNFVKTSKMLLMK
ncbi:MAG: choice-of-anchor J domain-containing protein [Calditrichia bacterium]